jgi:HTH-type transcriptional regulator, cell division transcriptional repressor
LPIHRFYPSIPENILVANIMQENIVYIHDVTNKNIIGRRVRLARKSTKPPITQLDLVARLQTFGLEIDQSRLSKIETGQRPVTDIEVAAIVKALRITVEYLFDNEEKPPESENIDSTSASENA